MSAEIINEVVKLGALAALFALGMWLVYALVREGISHMVEIERMRMEGCNKQAEALLEHAKRDERELKLSRDIDELRILLQRLLQIVERNQDISG